MQLSRLQPKTREAYTGKKVEVKHPLFRGEAVLLSFHNHNQAVIQFKKPPVKKESHFQQRGELRQLTVDIKCIFI